MSDRARLESVLLLISALLGAGLDPGLVWEEASRFVDHPIVSRMARGSRASSVADRLDEAVRAALVPTRFSHVCLDREEVRGWAELVGAWSSTEEAGCGLVPVIDALIVRQRNDMEAHGVVARLLLSARMTGRVLTGLPLLGILALVASPMGMWGGAGQGPALSLLILPLSVAALLGAVSVMWRRALVIAATRQRPWGAFHLELTAHLLAAGLALPEASRLARKGARRGAAIEGRNAAVGSGIDDRILDLSERTGLPLHSLLSAEAVRQNAAWHADALDAAIRLEAKQLVPLAVCDLPAFLLAAVVPVVLLAVRSL